MLQHGLRSQFSSERKLEIVFANSRVQSCVWCFSKSQSVVLDVVQDPLSVFPRAQSPNNPSSLDRMTSSSVWSSYYVCMVHIDTGGK